MTRAGQGGVLGVFSYVDTTVAAARRMDEMGFRDIRAVSPVPRHEILDVVNPGPSPVRYYSLVGALSGLATGIGLAIGTSLNMQILAFRTSGKPVVSWPPFLVIGFELTVLFGALATMLGFIIHAWLPRRAIRKTYLPEFTLDKFGVFVPCGRERWDEVKRALEQAGAEEVRVEEA